jgi:YVTN family beta-propeller protein
MSELPRGTVTFLFTDIEGSTQLLKQLGADYGDMLAEHQRILRAAFAAHNGREVDTQGDSFFVAFGRGKDAVAAAVDAQRDLAAQPWPNGVEVRVRMGLHTGEPRVGDDRYVGLGVHKAARIAAAGHGGQVLLSRTTRELVEDELPAGVAIRDLGERRLKDVDRPEQLSQLEIAGLRTDFGQLKTLDVELRRRRRRMYGGAALVGVVAAAVAIPVFALGQGDAGGDSASIEPNSVAIIDAVSNEVQGSVPVGVRPSAVAVGHGAVWVGNLDDESVARINPNTRLVERSIALDSTPTGLAVGEGFVWAAEGLAGSVSQIDPSVNAVSRTYEALAPRSNAGTIALGEGSAWFVSGIGTVARITGSETSSGFAGSGPSAVTVGAGAVWVANKGENAVVRINPRTLSVVRTVSVGRSPRGIAFADGAVWVANEGDDVVTRIDTASSSTTTIPVGDAPIAVAVGAGSVWVVNSDDASVSRIDPESNEVVATIALAHRPAGIAVSGETVWVAIQPID